MVESGTAQIQIKVEQILDAAEKRFAHYSLSKTTMHEIAGDLGMSKASLYYYFKDKESIFIAVIEREQNEFFEKIKTILAAQKSSATMLLAYTDFRLMFLQKLLAFGKLTYSNYREVKPLFTSLLARFEKRELEVISVIIKQGVKDKEFKIADLSLHARLFLSALKGLRLTVINATLDKGKVQLPKNELLNLKQQSVLFTSIFIKGISA